MCVLVMVHAGCKAFSSQWRDLNGLEKGIQDDP